MRAHTSRRGAATEDEGRKQLRVVDHQGAGGYLGARMRTTRVGAGALLTLAMALGAPRASAQPTGEAVATAQALFDDGKRLMDAGNYERACPKLVESQRLDPAGGTLLLIGLCHEAQGKTATAWADFGVALGQARKDNRADREAAALEHVQKLEPKLTRVRVVVAPGQNGIEVLRNGVVVNAAQWGTPLPIDPGTQTFEARAPGKRPWSQKVDVVGEGVTVPVQVPLLADAEPSPSPPPVAPPPPAAPDKPAPQESSSRLPWIALAGGVGVVAAGVGVGFGLSATSKWKDAERACPGGLCPNAADTELGKQAGTRADLSTVFFIIGGAGLATAGVLWLTAPSTQDRGVAALRVVPSLGRDRGGLVLRGVL